MESRLPVIREINLEPKVTEIYESLEGEPFSFLLDSSMVVREIGEYSFLGSDPFLVFCSRGNEIEIVQEGNVNTFVGNPLDKLDKLLEDYVYLPDKKLFPFHGGAVGFFSYDLGRRMEVLPETAVDDLGTPELCLGFFDTVVVVDHSTGKVYISSTGLPKRGQEGYRRALKRIEELEKKILSSNDNAVKGGLTEPSLLGLNKLKSNFTPTEYMETVEKVKDYIRAGDITEVNLTQRFEIPLEEDPWEIYKRLRVSNSAPFAGFLNFGDFNVLSSSPERFLKVSGRKIETRPIKGTRPRGKDPEEDIMYRRELLESEKDKAELMLAVDVGRNDLSQVCEKGSVCVPDPFRLEEYPTVFHLVSTVEGDLAWGKTMGDLLKATFPGASITGAPKIRSMEIIEELEKIRRGIYTGSMGYIDFNGDADLNIVIRTIICRKGKAYFQVGGAITLDSDPKEEYFETLDKGRALMEALGFSKGELMGWKV